LNQQFSKNIGATFVWKKLNPTFFKSDIIFPKLLDQQFLEMLPIFLKILDQQIFKISDKHFSINVEPTFHYQKVDYIIFSKKPTFFRHQHSSSSASSTCCQDRGPTRGALRRVGVARAVHRTTR
jgi:hypothetical protein